MTASSKHSILLALLLIPLLSFGCAVPPPASLGPTVSRQVPVTVENRSWDNLTIYAVYPGGGRVRLGDVEASGRVSLVLPRGVSGTVQLLADPVGSMELAASEQLYVAPGDRIEWTIENVRSLSFSLVQQAV